MEESIYSNKSTWGYCYVCFIKFDLLSKESDLSFIFLIE